MDTQTTAGTGAGADSSSVDGDSASFTALIDALDLDDMRREILKKRWERQTDWFGRRAQQAKSRMTAFRVVIVVGGVLLPALAVLPDSAPASLASWGTPVVSFIVAATAGLDGFFKYSDLYTQYRESAELLKIEGWSYFALSGEYGRYRTHSDAFEKFTQRVEDVIRRDVRAVVSTEAERKPSRRGG